MTIKTAVRDIFNRSEAGRRAYRALNKVRVGTSRVIPDPVYARMKHWENTGRRLDLKNPQTLSEKIWWLKLNNRDPLLTVCSDKVAARDYVRDAGFPEILVPSPGSYTDPAGIPFDTFDVPTYLKINNGCGANMVYYPDAPFDRQSFVHRFRKDMQSNYYWQSREWNYKFIRPAILAERAIEAEDLVDFRFMCFDGKVRLIFVDVDTALPDGQHFTGAARNVYTPDYTPIDVKVARERYPLDRVPRPPDLERMIEIAERLSEPFPFCRVDLYNTAPGVIHFGEITFSPGGGSQLADPYEFEYEWGSWIDLDSPKIIRK